jgi:hypothetical protein
VLPSRLYFRQERITPRQPLNPFHSSTVYSELARETLAVQPVSAIAKAWAIGAVKTVATPALLHDQRVRGLSNASFHSTSGSLPQRVWQYLADNTPSYRFVAVVTMVGAASASILQLFGAVIWFRQARLRWSFGAAIVMYFMVLNGPVADAKYRLPMEPVLIVATACALVWLYAQIKRRWKPEQ